MLIECYCCKTSFNKAPSQIRKTLSGRHFCSHSCAAKINNLGVTRNPKAVKIEPVRNPFVSKCLWHKCQKEFEHFGIEERVFCSLDCKNKQSVQRRRYRVKLKAIVYKGGKCEVCGYGKCMDALEFHHVDPTEKEFSVSAELGTSSWEKIQIELDKCVLLCANCHRETHYGEKKTLYIIDKLISEEFSEWAVGDSNPEPHDLKGRRSTS